MFKNSVLPILVLLCLSSGAPADGLRSQVYFSPGTDSKTITGSVLRGERDTYLVDASAGQKMWIRLNSTEGNGFFDLYSPGGELFEQETRSLEGRLPQSGRYKIVVSPNRGNASYQLTITIR